VAGIAGIGLAAASAVAWPWPWPRPQSPRSLAERFELARSLEAMSVLHEPETPLRPWRVVDGTQWQLESPEAEFLADAGDSDPQDDPERGPCPEGMVEAVGAMKLDGPRGTVEDLQGATCTEWVEHPEPRRCNAFDAARWAAIADHLPTRPMHFCIDRYEYPDRVGEYPVVMVDWLEAQRHCTAQGKRLCTEDEWTFACEGTEARPYPTGFVRDARACNIDRPWRPVDFQVLASRTGPRVERELDALFQGEPAGTYRGCRSPFGAYDMTGNVDEWTVTTHAEGLRSILKGGYWSVIHARCRTSTRVHNEWFYFYQIGFRCCAGLG
jgi:hypothetical protein